MKFRAALAACALGAFAPSLAGAQPRPTWDVYVSKVDVSVRWNATTKQYDATVGVKACALSLVTGDKGPITFDVDVYLDRKTAPRCGERGADATVTFSLAPGDCDSVTGVVAGVPIGAYRTWAFADARCKIVETVETNNAKYATWTVGAGKVDLSVSSFSAVVRGSDVTLYGTLCNKGGETRDYAAALFLGASTRIGCTDVPFAEGIVNVAADRCERVTVTFPGVPPGRYSLALKVDSRCQVPEADETNNARATTFSVSVRCRTNADCASKEYCRFDAPCGGTGTCVRRPDACIMVYDPVCGCDGKTYSNACVAASRGVNVRSKGACSP